MPKAILGRKIGMTRLYNDGESNIPVTIIQAGPCFISQIKTSQSDGYSAIQLAYGDVKARNSTIPLISHDAKAGIDPKRVHREVKVDEKELEEYKLGQQLTVSEFDEIPYVDVCGYSKGKGFAGVIKRWGFAGQEASHGVKRTHRAPGSIGGHANNTGKSGKIKKGKKMAGHMGNEKVTVRSLPIVAIDKERNLIVVKGPVPGPKQGTVLIRQAVRLYKRKTNKD